MRYGLQDLEYTLISDLDSFASWKMTSDEMKTNGIFFTQTRDSDFRTEFSYKNIVEAAKEKGLWGEHAIWDFRASCWAHGWREHLCFNVNNEEVFDFVAEVQGAIQDYCFFGSESGYYSALRDEAHRLWSDVFSDREKVEYISEYAGIDLDMDAEDFEQQLEDFEWFQYEELAQHLEEIAES